MENEPKNEQPIDESVEEQTANPTNEVENKDVEDNKLWALLSYLGALVVIPLLIKRESKFCDFHVRQGLLLLLGWIIGWVPVFGFIIDIIVIVLSIMGIISVLKGEMRKLPLIGDAAEKIKL